jgi:uncharacterized protein YlxP (DUF503 family)
MIPKIIVPKSTKAKRSVLKPLITNTRIHVTAIVARTIVAWR